MSMRLITIDLTVVVFCSNPGVKMAQTPLKFQDVQIKKANRLGIGKKDLVYRSMCDGLPCAAKMIQPRNLAGPENEYIVSTINKQFELLSHCQHCTVSRNDYRFWDWRASILSGTHG